jgi:hypothetical protein
MKRLLLKRNVSRTRTSLKELLSPIKMSRSERKPKTDEPLVEQFLSELREAGVKIIRDEVTLPRFYRHPNKGENREIGGDHASKNPTSVY